MFIVKYMPKMLLAHFPGVCIYSEMACQIPHIDTL